MPPYMKYFVDRLTPELFRRAKEELGETEEIRIKSLNEIKTLIQDEPDFEPCLEESFVLRFLRQKKFKVEEAFKALKKYYKFKARYSGILVDFKPSELREVLNQHYFSVLEHRDNEDGGVGILFNKFDMKRFTADEIIAAVVLFVQMLMEVEATQIAGYSLVSEYTGYTWSMARHFTNPVTIYRVVSIVQDVIPSRVKAFHVVNQPLFFTIVIKIALRLIPKKLMDRVYLHGSDMSSLHKYVPREILPEELGGTQGPIENYAKECTSKLMNLEEYFVKMSKYGYRGKTLDNLRSGSVPKSE